MNVSLYKQAKWQWDKGIGSSVRSILDLADSAGAWLWFFDAITHNYDDVNELTAGTVVDQMLQYKINERNSRKS